jgi:hypothetical protein
MPFGHDLFSFQNANPITARAANLQRSKLTPPPTPESKPAATSGVHLKKANNKATHQLQGL